MSTFRSRTVAFALLAIVSFAACDAGGIPPLGPGQIPLFPRTWYMHTANDSTLPAVIATRIIGAALESTVLDSAQLTVNVDGTYSQRYWLRVFVTSVFDRGEVVSDDGTWASDPTGYTFNSTIRTRQLRLTIPETGRVRTVEPMVFFTSAPSTVGLYRSTRP